MVFRFPTHAAG